VNFAYSHLPVTNFLARTHHAGLDRITDIGSGSLLSLWIQSDSDARIHRPRLGLVSRCIFVSTNVRCGDRSTAASISRQRRVIRRREAASGNNSGTRFLLRLSYLFTWAVLMQLQLQFPERCDRYESLRLSSSGSIRLQIFGKRGQVVSSERTNAERQRKEEEMMAGVH